MKILSTLFFVFLFAGFSFAQVKHDYNWEIGNGANADGIINNGMSIKFTSNPVTIEFSERDIDMWGTNTSMSDAEGNLIFYTNGCKIFNADHELMENGNNINAGEVNDIQCPDDELDGAYTVTNGILALPDPGSDSLYYIFHQRIIYLYDPFNVKVDQLLYSVVNMNKEEGRGAIVLKDQVAIADTLCYGDIAAVQHANGEDWWIVSAKNLTDTMYVVALTNEGVQSSEKHQAGAVHQGDGYIHETCFSPDGSKYARHSPLDQIHLYEFDRTTGTFSNFQQLHVADTTYSAGIAISPNSRYMYVSNLLELYQYDLWDTDKKKKKKVVGIYDGFTDFTPTTFGRMQLGPDCRIYMMAGSNPYYSVINKPDRPGLACDLRQHGLELPYHNFRAMPKFPNYRLGTIPTYPCDSTIAVNLTSSILEVAPPDVNVLLYPNPVQTGGELTIELQNNFEGEILLYDLLGQTLATHPVANWERLFRIALPTSVGAGVYYWVLRGKDGEVASGKLAVFNEN
ncbi:MAG: T9SS type A sorting domain-containing protein [Saprospiraceae bacterium]